MRGGSIAIRGQLGQWSRKRTPARQHFSPSERRRRRSGTGSCVAGRALRNLPDLAFDNAGRGHFSDRIGRSLSKASSRNYVYKFSGTR